MRPNDLRKLLKTQPFEPIRLGLSDGRSLLIRHPDQVVVSERKLYAGLTKVQRSRPLATPQSGDSFAPDWVLVDLHHIVSAEPEDGGTAKRTGKRRKSQ